MENYINKIIVNHSRNVKNLTIPFSTENRQHLILTGKNGSGKTSLLLELNKYLTQIDNGNFQSLQQVQQNLKQQKQTLKSQTDTNQRLTTENSIKSTQNWLDQFGGSEIKFSTEAMTILNKCQKGEFLLAFFDSKRHTKLNIPTGIQKVSLKNKYSLTEKASPNFLQYIVNLKADRSFARDDNETETVNTIDSWFNRFESRLKSIFNDENLKLKFDRKEYNFNIITKNGEPLNFNTLPDGYSSIISIVSELLLRMESHSNKSYDLEGIVIIDEIETHLHVDLQKKILPFLIDFFPRLQFIITTHSPFVLQSISNATICDLETRTITTDLTSYSYDALIESYFKTDKYSEEVKNKIKEFEKLIEKSKKTNKENEHLRSLRNYFAHSPKYLSNELLAKLQEIQLKEITKIKK
jgi:predicted ATP-binding protein involved in virulence